MSRPVRSLAFAVAASLAAVAASAQAPGGAVSIGSRQRAGHLVEPGTTVSTVFTVTSRLDHRTTIVPKIAAPADWAVVMGTASFALDVRETDTWIVSVVVPAQARHGRYVVPVSLLADGAVAATDSLVVEVKEHHAIDVMLLEAPSYVVAGTPYRATFLVQNHGNGTAQVRLSASSARGTGATLSDDALVLDADSSRAVTVNVGTGSGSTDDDVLEMRAQEAVDSLARAVASARVMIVAPPGATQQVTTVPAFLRLRAAGQAEGVAPFELVGGGRLRPDGPERIDFVMRGPTGPSSLIGEREEYRVAIHAPNYRLRLGDDLYGTSAVTSTGRGGFGAGGDMAVGAFVASGYAQRFRYSPEGEAEGAASLAYRPGGLASTSQLGVTAMERLNGQFAGRVLSSNLVAQPIDNVTVDAEVARSAATGGNGSAGSVHVSGNSDIMQFDIGHMAASAVFAGPMRGSQHDYATLNAPLLPTLRLTAGASSHTSSQLFGGSRLQTGSIGMTQSSGLSLSYIVASRGDSTPLPGINGTQHGVVMRGDHAFGAVRTWSSLDAGTMRDAYDGSLHQFRDYEAGGSMDVGVNSVSAFGHVYRGESITRGPVGLGLVGGSAYLRLSSNTSLNVLASHSLGHAGATAYSLVDASLARSLRSGATLTLRARLGTQSADVVNDGRVVFLEYGTPLHVPVAPIRAPGRVKGWIVNSETGRGVAGALVRLGSQAAITDDDGSVTFSGLAPGEYRVSLAQNMSLARSAIDGDPRVRVEAARRDPAIFRLEVARAASIRGTVRRTVVAKTGLGDAPDSLVDAGPLRGAVVALAAGGDTLYRTVDDSGYFHFAELPPKDWNLSVATPAPAQSQFEPASVNLTLAPGENAEVRFRSMPHRRTVHMMEQDDTPLMLQAPAPPPASAPVSGPHRGRTTNRQR